MRLVVKTEPVAVRGSSRIDYDLNVDSEDRALVEVKSTSVMYNVCKQLPQNGFELTWARGQSLARKMLTKVSTILSSPTTLALKKYIQAALYLGSRRMEWLFISCHNYWIVCRLVTGEPDPTKRVNHRRRFPFLAHCGRASVLFEKAWRCIQTWEDSGKFWEDEVT